jgi:hypothetical protein
MRFQRLIAVGGILVMAAGLGGAAAAAGFSVRPSVFDPGRSGIIQSAWVAQQGLPDAGNSNHALFLQKNGPTPTNAAAIAEVRGVESITLSELGFDYRNDGHCGAGAPRFNVVTSDNVNHFFGCVYGAHTPVPGAPTWTRVRFSAADGFPPGGLGQTVKSVTIVLDEGTDQGQGFVYLDNVDVNGTLMGKPGAAN